ncbi:nascent polypeptide-associated complex subunit alpha, muscle-specific form-like isoform X1 [Macrobrachium nipponense]|uniref:nascent polypeptide-associated complex subunit alpha, muscle-specific form-like isoform X1 n=1 Tax=Macrobrachium nipponense TaxID=159736 RepID=UPI0030C7D84E
MSRWRVRVPVTTQRKDPLEICGSKHNNTTLDYHECLCRFDYRGQRHNKQPLKFKHCLLADEMRRIDNFQMYVIIAAVVGVVLIFGIAAFCSCKWYLQTNKNPCGCCVPNCKKKTKKKKDQDEVNVANEVPRTLEIDGGGQAWTPMRLAVDKNTCDRNHEPNHDHPRDSARRSGLCMNFCMSDPVQDCCEFFDCDLMWRKKSIYTIPIFGKRKPAPLQRRPTRPAPPPPKPAVTPVVKYPEPVHEGYEEGMDCEPVPEAPPSPEPIRTDQPRAMYVDPIAFLQKPFLKTSKDKATDDDQDDIYSKVKEFVFGKSKKSGSAASLNKLGISKSPDVINTASSKKTKYGRTGSLASLHNLSDEQLDTSYHSKRSISLASLHMVEEEPVQTAPKGKLLLAQRGSLHNICEDDDRQPSLKTDEYIDLEEMSKRMEAKMAAQGSTAKPNHVEIMARTNSTFNRQPCAPSPPVHTKPNWTPNFIPASAYTKPPPKLEACPSDPAANQPYPQVPVPVLPLDAIAHRGVPPQYLSPDAKYEPSPMRYGEVPSGQYYPPVPATPEKPAVPARISVGTPVVSVGTLGRPKPVVPPRPPNSGGNSPRPRGTNSPRPSGGNSPRSAGGNSPKPRAPQPPNTLGRHPHVMKPTAPPPPPPVTTPIESSL